MGTIRAEKACHNCRRRRLRCDRGVPACQKCSRTGQECLGYGKLFLWNQGVASRGKMMGQSYPVPYTRESKSSTAGLPLVSMQAPLLDPLLQGLNDTSRRYLFHFATHLSSEMVISDIANNPFRSLIPLCKEHPMLLHSIIANAALHLSCLHTQSLTGSADHATLAYPGDQSRILIDALSSKHKALVLLRQSLDDISTIDIDLLVAVIHFFITFELIGPGADEWRAHVQGAIRLINYLQTLQAHHVSPVDIIRDRITADCLTFYILGSTLMSTTSLSDPFLFPGDITAALTRAESTSYLSLPTPLLQVLFKACELSNLISLPNTNVTTMKTHATALLTTTTSFNIQTWASSLEPPSSPRAFSRIHTAHAHQNAVRLYICRSTNQISLLGEDPEAVVTKIITHLSFVGVTDDMFKATSWPTFMAGAETTNPVYRRWAVERLCVFWDSIPWGYLKTAVEVMRAAWGLRDGYQSPGVDGEGDGMQGSENWIQHLKGLKRYPLIA
ncbi:fungal-specific transcription factor domain-containing protein [Aspergillus californicus]